MRVLKFIVVLVVLGVAGLIGYAYLGDMSPRQQQMRVPVTLTEGAAGAGRATVVQTPTEAAAPQDEAAPSAAASDAPPVADGAQTPPSDAADALD